MTAWKALVPPRLGTTDGPGWCLRFAQSFFGAPARHNSAWEAWEATQHRHGPEVPLPDVPVLLWFSHWGWYGPKGKEVYANWGDVRIHVPGDAIYGSPITGTAVGQSRVARISDIERGIGATYVGWSEDINGLLVAVPRGGAGEPSVPGIEEEEDDMSTVYLRATSNSSPIEAGNPGTSRIWAGDDRVIGGAKYSGVWERSDSAEVPRRLFPGEWAAIQAAYAAAGRKVPYAEISGNELEKMYLVKRAAPQPNKAK